MSSVTLESGLGTISFDGQILELFGFGEQGSRRFHVGQIERIELGGAGLLGSQLVLDAGPAVAGLRIVMKLTDNDRASLEALVEEVRAAAAGGAT